MATSMAMPSERKTSLVACVAPPSSQVAPAGSVTPSSALFTAVEAAPMLLSTEVAVMLAVRAPSTWVTWTGAFSSTTLAMSPSGTMPLVPGTGNRVRTWLTAPGSGGTVISPTMSCAGSVPAVVGTVPSG
jgi:hypothetical protein